jgi:hypothetical protein
VAAAVSQLPHDYPTGWCFHHEQVHGPMEWSDGCQSPEDDEFTRQYQRFQQGWEAVEASERTVCWWKHRPRTLGDGAYRSPSCWACADPG